MTTTSIGLGSVLICCAAFFLNHFFSFRHNLERDARKVRNIGTIMFFPYARIIPMHLTIIVGGFFAYKTGAVVLFLILKTLADLAMHAVEHHQERDAHAPGETERSPGADREQSA